MSADVRVAICTWNGCGLLRQTLQAFTRLANTSCAMRTLRRPLLANHFGTPDASPIRRSTRFDEHRSAFSYYLS